MNRTTTKAETVLTWIAALLLVECDAPFGTKDHFGATKQCVREDLLGLTRQQADQEARATEDLGLIPSLGRADDGLLLCERERQLDDLVCDVEALAPEGTKDDEGWRPWMYAFGQDSPRPQRPKHRMQQMRWRTKPEVVKALAELRERFRQIA